jgi:subtilisin family serine protease
MLLVFGLCAGVAAAGEKDFIAGQCVVTLQPGGSIDAVNAAFGTVVLDRIPGQVGGDVYLLQLPKPQKTKKQIKKIAADPNVFAAGPNRYVVTPSAKTRPPKHHSPLSFPYDLPAEFTTDPAAYDIQPFLTRLRVAEAQARSTGAGVVVAVVDTGVQLDHPALADRLVPGYDFIGLDDDPSEAPAGEATGHGTFIAGLILKIAPDARVMPIRALDANGLGTAYSVAKGVDFAYRHGATVINLSFGAPDELEGLEEVIDEAAETAVVVVAAGNDDTEPGFPSKESDTLSVAAVDDTDVKASFSNFSSDVDLAAPGVALVSAFPGSGYAKWSGTSFSAPLVAAGAAMVFALSPATDPFRPEDVQKFLEDNSLSIDDLPGNAQYRGRLGRGRLDLVAALVAAQSGGGGGGDIDQAIQLVEVGPDPDASGSAHRVVESGKSEFEVEVRRLASGATYTLRVDGVDLDPIAVDGEGEGRLKYSTSPDPDEKPLPPELQPLGEIQTVEIVDGGGTVLLRGAF